MKLILSVTYKFINYEKQRYMKPFCENGHFSHRPLIKLSKIYF